MGGKRATRLRPATREPWRAEDLMPPVSCVCHLRPATACGRDTRHISDLTPPPHDITPDTDTHTAFYSHGFGVIFTGDRSQLQSLYMTFSHVWRGTILRSLNDFRLTYACTVLYLHTPYPVPVSPSQVSSCHVIALCGTSRYKRRADWASDAAERPVLSRSRRAGRGRRTAAG